MLFGKLFQSIFLSSLIDQSHKNMTDLHQCDIKYDLVSTILYESFIPLDAIVFYVGTNYPSKSELNKLIDAILISKKVLLEDATNMAKFFNLESPVNETGPIKEIIQIRNNIVKKDKSFIFKEIIKNNLFAISKCIRSQIGIVHQNKYLIDPKKDEEFKKTVLRLEKYISENQEINELLNKERAEFYHQSKPTKKALKAKIALSLGGSFINLKDMVELIFRINAADKIKELREWLNIMLEPIEKLQNDNIKGFMMQKFNIIDFLNECLDRKTGLYDSVFEIRDNILKAAKLSDTEKQKFFKRQRRKTESLIKIIKNIKKEQVLIKYSRQIKEDYTDFLITGQIQEKDKLMKNFKNF